MNASYWRILFGKWFLEVKMFCVYGFLKTNNMMVTHMRNYVTLDPDDDVADFDYSYRDIMIALFKQFLFNKDFSLQDQGKCDKEDTLKKKNKCWPNVFYMGVQYLIMFMIMITTTLKWIILSVRRDIFLRLEN